MLDSLRDLRFAVRTLFARHRSLTYVSILTLALGIGATTAISSVVDGVLLRPLPYPEPEQLVRLFEQQDGSPGYNEYLSVPGFLDYRDKITSFSEVASLYTYNAVGFDWTGGDRPRRVSALRVSADFFPLLRIEPLHGRSFLRDEERRDARVAILSHRLFTQVCGADPACLERPLTLDGVAWNVVGVMPDGIDLPGGDVDLWVTEDLGSETQRGNFYLSGLARLAPGATVSSAQAELDLLSAQIGEQHPEVQGTRAVLVPLHEELVGSSRPLLYVLLAAVVLVLLIACVNVANLSLVRVLAREQELAVRSALGSSRWRLVRQLLTESLVIAGLGGAAGWLVAMGGLELLVALQPDALPRLDTVQLDGRLFLFGILLTFLTGLAFGLVPALQGAGQDLEAALREGTRGGGQGLRQRRLQSVLVTAQVSLAVVLLVGAGLLMQSFLKLMELDLGFRPDNVQTFKLNLPEARYSEPVQRAEFYPRFHAAVESLPGVVAAGAISRLPMSGRYHIWGYDIEGAPPPAEGERDWYPVDVRVVAGRYFDAVDIGLVRGRLLDATDRADAPRSLVVNQALVRRSWPEGEPLGERLRIGGEPWTIVGVVDDVRHDHLEAAVPTAYLPHAQFADDRNWDLTQVVATDGARPDLLALVRAELARLDGDLVVHSERPLTAVVARGVARQRFGMQLMSAFAAAALVLAAVGIYGVLAYFVSRRTREIGIRMALGAGARQVRRLVLSQGLVMVAAGVVAGLLGALAAGRWLASLVYGLSVKDPATYLAVACVLALVALGAGWLPARRATRIDPLKAIRSE